MARLIAALARFFVMGLDVLVWVNIALKMTGVLSCGWLKTLTPLWALLAIGLLVGLLPGKEEH